MEEALNAARDVLLDAVKRGVVAEPMGRGSYGDLSYRGDIVCEEAIIEVLKGRLGSVVVVSEEGGISYNNGSKAEYWALIDPVDGSANMARRINFYSSGIALAKGPEIRDVVCSGVIDHVTGELFIREKDYTSHGDSAVFGKRPNTGIDGARLFFHHAALKRGYPSRDHFVKIAENLAFFRVMGSALLEMCLAGVGRSDGYLCLSPELRVMDIVPALYFALGVGCKAASYPGSIIDDRLDSRSRYGVILTRHPKLFEDTISVLKTPWNILT